MKGVLVQLVDRLSVEVEKVTVRIISACATQTGCEAQEKDDFWSMLGDLLTRIPEAEVVWIGADLNGHVGAGSRGASEVLGKHGVGMRNEEGDNLVEFAIAHQLAIVNTYFQKRLSRRITYTSGGVHTQVDYILCRRKELKRVRDCKVLPKEAAAKQHKVVACNAEIITRGKQRTQRQKKTRRWKLNESEHRTEYARNAEDKLESINEEERSWETVSKAMRDTATGVLGKTSGKSGKMEEAWWWNE